MPQTAQAVSRGLRLLGEWQLVVDGDVVALGGREQRLCALLALTGTRGRAQVAGTLWPESTDARALASLRRAVAQTHQRCPGLLVADRTSVALAADVEVDVHALRAAVDTAGGPDPGDDAPSDTELLVTLVGERLLPDWYDAWVEEHRDDLEHQRVSALERLARRALDRKDTLLAEDAARAVVRTEPLRESARELLARALLDRGDRGGAVLEVGRYRDLVSTELGVVPSPALLSLLEAPVPAVPVPRAARAARPAAPTAAPVDEVLRPAGPSSVPLDHGSPRPPPPPTPLPPSGPVGLSLRATAARLAVGAALVMAVSLSIANLGPDRAEPSDPVSVGDGLGQDPGAPQTRRAEGADPASAREVRVRPVGASEGAAVFLVRATRRPARVRLEVAGPSGTRVVRSVVVRSRDGRRLVVGGLDGGTYEWSATSPTAAPVVGEVRVAGTEAPVLVASEEPVNAPSPSPATASAGASTPVSSPAPTATPTSTPEPSPTSTPEPSPTPSPTPSHSPQPSPTQHPSPTGQPTDPGTQDPGPLG
ncbi:hypothetical protein GCM10009641_37330 [Mycobacterium cookii]|uniref:Bacterial transcriptional activator domain-containing protein n=1 Tax=Nocardioides furvisabuli TaxID=375542 RepID=A0ABN2X165_9ACTN|nr:BTAD domain-containing putative transcriptional regulator [Nocardioides furvisabuli]